MRRKTLTANEEVGIVRLGVYLPKDLHKALMHRCIDEEISATKLTERLLREYLVKSPKHKGGK